MDPRGIGGKVKVGTLEGIFGDGLTWPLQWHYTQSSSKSRRRMTIAGSQATGSRTEESTDRKGPHNTHSLFAEPGDLSHTKNTWTISPRGVHDLDHAQCYTSPSPSTVSPCTERHRPCLPRVPPLGNLDTHVYTCMPPTPHFDPPPHVTSTYPIRISWPTPIYLHLHPTSTPLFL